MWPGTKIARKCFFFLFNLLVVRSAFKTYNKNVKVQQFEMIESIRWSIQNLHGEVNTSIQSDICKCTKVIIECFSASELHCPKQNGVSATLQIMWLTVHNIIRTELLESTQRTWFNKTLSQAITIFYPLWLKVTFFFIRVQVYRVEICTANWAQL